MRLGQPLIVGVIVVLSAGLATGLGLSGSHRARASSTSSHSPRTTLRAAQKPRARPAPALLVNPPAFASARWSIVARIHGQPAAWLSERSGVTLLRFEQTLIRLDLHAGSIDGGATGWVYGDQITPAEIHHVVAAFNGGFKLTYANVGFMSGGRVAARLRPGLASIVTYRDGSTNIGTWGAGVPSLAKRVFSVLQNQQLLVDHGVVAASTATCVLECWGETVGKLTSVARSGLGITASGQLVWAAGEHLLPGELGAALRDAGAVRAIELDINPDWVAGYLYVHHPTGPVPVPVIPGQLGITGKLLEPYTRDFFVLAAR